MEITRSKIAIFGRERKGEFVAMVQNKERSMIIQIIPLTSNRKKHAHLHDFAQDSLFRYAKEKAV
jgi:hypothetical protein